MNATQFREFLEAAGFDHFVTTDTYTRNYGDSFDNKLEVDFVNKKLIYPAEIEKGDETTSNFSHEENFVVFECVHRLLEKGYQPKHLELEPKWKVGHGASGGKADIWIRTNKQADGSADSLMIIECKTFGREFREAWKDTLEDGAQLFGYFAQAPDTRFLCLYSSDWREDHLVSEYHLINVQDNEEYLKTLKDAPSYAKGKEKHGRGALFKAWKETYKLDYATRGVFEPDMAAYAIGKSEFTVDDLNSVDAVEIEKTYNRFAEILRKYNVSGRENAFDKLVNLMLAKVVDELNNRKRLQFNWKGAAYDDDFRLQDRLQRLYKDGMQKFLGEDVTYIDDAKIDAAFILFKNDPDATRDTILKYVRQLKFFTNNDFAFIDVHNEKLFSQNAVVLREIVRMLQDIRLRTDAENQFLGNLFEGFLDQGVKQSEGQFFTPIPFVRFMVSSLPVSETIDALPDPPVVLDYACGAGHFLNEYARQAAAHLKETAERKAAIEKAKHPKKDIKVTFDPKPYYDAITGIEKEYRLSKVSKVAAFMYGQDQIHIVYADALVKNARVKDGTVNFLITNPPYSVKGFLETLSEGQRAAFRLSDCVDDLAKNDDIECFFVERAAQLMAPGGMAAIVLPSSVLTAKNIFVRCREILLESFDIVAIVEMGNGTFGKTNTSTATLFLRRKLIDPDGAQHIRNRVAAWFKGDFKKDGVFKDADVRTRYCAAIGADPADYDVFLKGACPSTLAESEMFTGYRAQFTKSARARAILKKKIRAGYTKQDQEKEFESCIWEQIREIEQDKLMTFMLADANPQPVLVVKGPTDTDKIKEFLGYEWSGRKGAEGLHVLGVAEQKDDDFKGNRGIDEIKTPMFNPLDTKDAKKICSLIRANFNGQLNAVPDELSEWVHVLPLAEMLDFRRVEFEKKIHTDGTRVFELVSKWPMEKLSACATIVRGVTYQKGDQVLSTTENVILTADNITRDGEFELTKPVYLRKSFALDDEKRLKKDDCFMCFSSGSKEHVGKVALICKDMSFYAGGFMGILRANSGKMLPRYLYELMNASAVRAVLRASCTGSNIQNLSNAIGDIKVPVPPLVEQKKLVTACEAIDLKVKKAESEILKLRMKLSAILDGLKGRKTISLSEMCVAINPPKSEVAAKPGSLEVTFVDMSSVSNDGYIEQRQIRTIEEVRKGGYTYFAEGDVIVAKITPCMENGKCALANDLKNGIGFGSSEFHVFRANSKASGAFLFYCLNRDGVRRAAEKVMTGSSGHKRVPIEFYENLPVPNITLAEQKKIVDAIKVCENKIAVLKKQIADCRAKRISAVEKFLA